MNGKTMEREWFDWKDWDGDQDYMQFYNVVLTKQIGRHQPGTKFSSACINFHAGVIEFFDDLNEVVGRHRIGFAIGEEVPD